MKNKFKALLAAFVGLFAFSAVAVGVNATSYTQYGSVAVSTTTNAGDTKTWDFTTNKPASNQSLSKGDDALGIVAGNSGYDSYTKDGKVKNTSSSIKKDGSGFSIYGGGYIYIPVISSSSSGTLTTTNGSTSGRYVFFYKNDDTFTSNLQQSTMKYDFTSDNIYKDPESNTGYYLKLAASNNKTANDTTSTNTGELKITTFQIVLTSGETYGAADIKYTVTYKDGESTINTEEIVKDNKVSYTPKKYGYDFEGWYTDSALTNKIDTATYAVTEAVTLYANWTAWTTTGIEEYSLSNSAIEKIASGIDGSLTSDLALAPSIYTYMKGGAMTTTNVTLPGATEQTQSPCFNTNGKVSTSGNGLKFTAPSNGTLIACVGSGGGSDRNIVLTDGTNELTPTSGSLAINNAESGYTPREVVFELTAGTTYYLGGSNGVRIYYVSFTPVNLNFQVNKEYTDSEGVTVAAGSQIRFVGTINCLTAETLKDATATLKLTLGEKTANVEITSVYTSVAIDAQLTFEAATNVYYVVFIISGLDDASLVGVTLTAQLDVTVGGTTYSSVVKTHTIA